MGDEGDPDVNAQLAALATGLAGLQTAVTQLVSAVSENVADTARRIDAIDTDARVRGARGDAAAAPAAAGRNPLVEAIEKLSQPTVKEVNGQAIRPFDFIYTDPPLGEHFSLPSEPYHMPDQAAIIKNEVHLFKTTQRRRIDPREASPSYWKKEFESLISTPHKQAVLMFGSYDDSSGAPTYYAGMQVWF